MKHQLALCLAAITIARLALGCDFLRAHEPELEAAERAACKEMLSETRRALVDGGALRGIDCTLPEAGCVDAGSAPKPLDAGAEAGR